MARARRPPYQCFAELVEDLPNPISAGKRSHLGSNWDVAVLRKGSRLVVTSLQPDVPEGHWPWTGKICFRHDWNHRLAFDRNFTDNHHYIAGNKVLEHLRFAPMALGQFLDLHPCTSAARLILAYMHDDGLDDLIVAAADALAEKSDQELDAIRDRHWL